MSEEIPVYPSAALGYRIWLLIGGLLRPLYQTDRSIWLAEENIAYCNIHAHPAPAPDCQCGFNAYHSLSAALRDAKMFMSQPAAKKINNGMLVVGTIAGRGHIEIHQDGFRCQRAQILALAPISFGPTPLDDRNQLHDALAPAYHKIPLYDQAYQLKDAAQQTRTKMIPTKMRPHRGWGRFGQGLALQVLPLIMFLAALVVWDLAPGWGWGAVAGCAWGALFAFLSELRSDLSFPQDWKRLF